MHRELAKITGTFLGVEDHGIFTAMLNVDFESGSSTSVGGYCLDEPVKDTKDRFRRIGRASGMQFVMNVIRACGAPSWEKLPGTMIYVLREKEAWGKALGVQGLAFGNRELKPFIFDDVFASEEA